MKLYEVVTVAAHDPFQNYEFYESQSGGEDEIDRIRAMSGHRGALNIRPERMYDAKRILRKHSANSCSKYCYIGMSHREWWVCIANGFIAPGFMIDPAGDRRTFGSTVAAPLPLGDDRNSSACLAGVERMDVGSGRGNADLSDRWSALGIYRSRRLDDIGKDSFGLYSVFLC